MSDYGLLVTPYEYQKEGIEYGLKHKRLIIGDEMGLGKTLQAIGVVNGANAYPCLVVCPSSLKINWVREFERFTGRNALVLEDRVRTTWSYLLSMKMYDVAVCNYESLKKYFVLDIRSSVKGFRLKDVVFCEQIDVFKSVVVDECHRVKEPTSHQSIFTKGLAKGKRYVVMLSGTPVVNRPEDLIAQLSIMDRLKDFGGSVKFRADFCFEKGGKPNVPLSELSDRLYDNCMIRRVKRDVLTELPDITRVKLHVDISNREEYSLAENDLKEYLREYKQCTDREIRRKMRMAALVRFMTLRSIATRGKVAAAIDFISDYLAQDRKLIVFCALHEVVDEIVRAFPDAVTVTGRDSAMEKQMAVDRFQGDCSTRLIVCSIKAAGVGLTLTAASSVLFVELAWTFADCAQCEARAHRIGQKDNVTAYYMLGDKSIDEVVYSLINTKKSIASEITGDDDNIPTNDMYFDELVTAFVEEK